MAWIALAAMAVSSVMGAKGNQDSANAQATQIRQDASQDQVSAQQIQDQGYQTAKRIRQKGDENTGAADAAMAASGVDVSQGTAQDVRKKITQNTEQDALNTILSSDLKATNLRTQAEYKMDAANDTVAAGKASALGSLFKGAGSTASAWKTAS